MCEPSKVQGSKEARKCNEVGFHFNVATMASGEWGCNFFVQKGCSSKCEPIEPMFVFLIAAFVDGFITFYTFYSVHASEERHCL